MLWTCLYFPELPLDALVGTEAQGRATVVVDGPAQRPQVVLANSLAQAAGIVKKQPLANARARAPDLLVCHRDRRAETLRLRTLAACAYRYSSQVVIAAPRALLIEAGSSLRLFGGWPALERRLRADFEALNIVYRLAIAPLPSVARLLATCRDGIAVTSAAPMMQILAQIPLQSAGLGQALSKTLLGMGLRRLGELFELPRAELTRRIGAPALEYLDQLRGLAPQPLNLYQPQARYEQRLEFDHCIENVQALLFPLQRLLREFSFFLTARDGGVQSFQLLLEHENRARTRVPVGLLAPQCDAAALLEYARGRLERLDLPGAVIALSIIADDLPPLLPVHRDLFDSGRREALEWPGLAERLVSRLGDSALRHLRCVADHRPERAWRSVALNNEVIVGARKKPIANECNEPGIRPLWLLPRPIPLRPSPAQILSGPERIESGWWDGADARRDYYVVRTTHGQRAWAFVPSGLRDGWMLHGWFA